MSELLTYLANSSPVERRRVAGTLVGEMSRGTTNRANLAYLAMCQRIIDGQGPHETLGDDLPYRGEFAARDSAVLVASVPRVGGFLRAIARAPQAETIVDAGCGSTALLAVGAAVTHPRAAVVAYELNEPAAKCAEEVVTMLGMGDRIDVRVGDIMTEDMPDRVDLAVTETFYAGLRTEMGPRITTRLAGSAREVLPAFAVLHACDTEINANTVWQRATTVDLSVDNERVAGRLVSTGKGFRNINAYVSYYDARHTPILVKPGTNNLTNPVPLGSVYVPQSGTGIEFNYALCVDAHEQPASLYAVS